MKLDVVMLVFERYELLKTTLPLLKSTLGPDNRLLVYDDGSKDARVRELITTHADEVVICDKNKGIGHGLKTMLEYVTTEHFIYVESDCKVYNGWVQDVEKEIENYMHDTVAWMGFKIVKNPKEMAFFYRNLDEMGETIKLPSSSDPAHPDNNGINRVTAPANVLSVYSKSALKKIGGPDPNLKRQWIDADLGLSFEKANYVCLANGALTFTHLTTHNCQNQDVKDHQTFKEKWVKKWREKNYA